MSEPTEAELTIKHQILSGYLDTKPGQGPKELQECILKKLFHPSTVWAIVEYLEQQGVTKAPVEAMEQFKKDIDEQMFYGHLWDTSFEFAYRTGEYSITKKTAP